MRMLILSAALLATAACNETQAPETDTAGNEAMAGTEAPAVASTSWEWTNEAGELRTTSFQPDGGYVVTAPEGETVESGNWVAKPGLTCLDDTSNEDDDRCFKVTEGETAIGESQEISNDAGETLTITRREYAPPAAG